MELIKLSKGKFAKVDPEDFERVSAHSWHALESGGNFYARGYVDGVLMSMPEFILGVKTDVNNVIDHINRDTLDDRKSNLRFCTKSQNQMNRYGDTKGVYFNNTLNRWVVQIRAKGQRRVTKYFKTEQEARTFAKVKYAEIHGEFASVVNKAV